MPKSVQVNTRVEPDLAEQLFIEAVERGRAQARAGQGRDLDAVNADLERIIAGHRKPN